jgi:hypothetical protein
MWCRRLVDGLPKLLPRAFPAAEALTPSWRVCLTPFTALRGEANNMQATSTPRAGATCFIMMLSDVMLVLSLLLLPSMIVRCQSLLLLRWGVEHCVLN